MKFTRWAVGLWSLTALLMLAGNADAWLFNHCGGCHGCHSHCHHCYETHICCRAYNAFTPICWGNLYCDGCCPNMGGGGGGCCASMGWSGCAPGSLCAAPWGVAPQNLACTPYPLYPGYGDPNQVNPGMLPSVPTSMPLPPGAVPTPPVNNVPPVLNHTAQVPYPGPYYYGMQPQTNFGYYPVGYWPGYNPYYYGYNYGQPQR